MRRLAREGVQRHQNLLTLREKLVASRKAPVQLPVCGETDGVLAVGVARELPPREDEAAIREFFPRRGAGEAGLEGEAAEDARLGRLTVGVSKDSQA